MSQTLYILKSAIVSLNLCIKMIIHVIYLKTIFKINTPHCSLLNFGPSMVLVPWSLRLYKSLCIYPIHKYCSISIAGSSEELLISPLLDSLIAHPHGGLT